MVARQRARAAQRVRLAPLDELPLEQRVGRVRGLCGGGAACELRHRRVQLLQVRLALLDAQLQHVAVHLSGEWGFNDDNISLVLSLSQCRFSSDFALSLSLFFAS
jgi:hypothetical protein